MRRAESTSTFVLAMVLVSVGLLAAVTAPSAEATSHVPDECLEDADSSGVDVLFAFDLTGSMSGEIDSAKQDAEELLGALDENLSDPQYGVASFMDYPGYYEYPGYSAQYGDADAGDYPWAVNQTLTDDTLPAREAIENLTLGYGADGPESYSRVLYEATELQDWRDDAIKVLVMWGDNTPHDDDFDGNNYGLDPGRDATEGGGDDLDFQEVVDHMSNSSVRAMMVNAGGSGAEPYYRYAANETNGNYTELNDAEELADDIVAYVDDITKNDTEAPSVDIGVPEPGHLYVDGVDYGPGTATYEDRASVAGNLSFEAEAKDNCLLERAEFETEPTTSWSYTNDSVNNTTANLTTSPFPADDHPTGNYTLFANVTDWMGFRAGDEALFEVVRIEGEPPYWVDADTICDETHRTVPGETISFDLTAQSDNVSRVVSLNHTELPDGASFPIPDPANPVSSTFSWTPTDNQTGTYNVTFTAIDDEGVPAPTCPVTLEVLENPIYWVEPECSTSRTIHTGEEFTLDVTAASVHEGDLLTLGVDGLPDGASFPIPDPANPVSSTFSWTPTVDQVGTHNVTFTVQDDDGNSGPDCPVTLVVRVPPEWDNPEPVCGTQRFLLAGDLVRFDVRARSEDANRTVALDVSGLPSGASFPIPDPANPVSSTFNWTPEFLGEYEVTFLAEDDLGVSAPPCPVTINVLEPRGQALAQGLWAGTAVPASAEVETATVDQRGPGSGHHNHLVVDQPEANLYAEALEETAEVEFDETNGTTVASGATQVARVELWGGLVVLEGLEQQASLTWDIRERNYTIETNPSVSNVTIGNETFHLNGTDETLRLPIPGGGELVLFEQRARELDQGVDYEETLVHAYAPAQYGRHEVILGGLELRAGEAPGWFGYEDQTRRMQPQDDAASGRDAGASPAGAVGIETGLFRGELPRGDGADYYAIDLEHGEKVNLGLLPAARGAVESPLLTLDGTNPSARRGDVDTRKPPGYTLELYDPTGERREHSSLVADSTPERIELNADITGTWHVAVFHNENKPMAYNYSLAASVTPLPLLPSHEAAPWGDHPAACDPSDEAIPTIDTGLWPGVFKHDDFDDVYRFDAEIGELISVALKPGETLDGVEMALTLWDKDCNQLERSHLTPAGLKGAPQAVFETPAEYTGEHFIGVHRLNGVGNYYLNLDIVNPQPALPQNDALTGEDAASECSAGTPAPPALFQGQLHDGDAADAYLLQFRENYEAFVAVEMSAGALIDVNLTAPNGTEIDSIAEIQDETYVYAFQTPERGDYCLEVTPIEAGGNYLVTHAAAPLFEPLVTQSPPPALEPSLDPHQEHAVPAQPPTRR